MKKIALVSILIALLAASQWDKTAPISEVEAKVVLRPTVALSGAYNREEFKHWIDADHDCQDTRQEVLIRDADGPLTMSDDGCRVLRGVWTDPYTGKIFTDPSDLDIDHVVPLKNAYDSGAWAWDSKKKEAYANDLDRDYYLLAVSASENRRKGDKGPDGYLPPNKGFVCEYIRDFKGIKWLWRLEITAEELNAIRNSGCIK